MLRSISEFGTWKAGDRVLSCVGQKCSSCMGQTVKEQGDGNSTFDLHFGDSIMGKLDKYLHIVL